MAETLRTFIAISVPCSGELRGVIRRLGEMGSAVKPVSPEKLHITLKFLGDTPRDQLPEITAAVQESIAGIAGFEMQLAGLGAFPKKQRPSVVWAGVEQGEPLVEIAARLEDLLETLDFERERRAFSPHLTLARVRRKPPGELFAMFDEHAGTRFGGVPVDAVRLYQSELQPDGPRYTVLDEARLEQPGS